MRHSRVDSDRNGYPTMDALDLMTHLELDLLTMPAAMPVHMQFLRLAMDPRHQLE